MAAFKRVPFEALTALMKVYGPVFQLRMGSIDTLVITSEAAKKEVLQTKGNHFDARPEWQRFAIMFGGDRNNSLAFCDMSSLQSSRRRLLTPHTAPHSSSLAWVRLDSCCQQELRLLTEEVARRARQQDTIDIKPLLTAACANIFNTYFCTLDRRNYDDPILTNYCDDFDNIFWEVNNGRAMDVLPWLGRFMGREMAAIRRQTASIRRYVMAEILEPRLEARRAGDSAGDMLDAWVDRTEEDAKKPVCDTTVNMDMTLFALEDILGGHSACANVALRALIDLGTNPGEQAALRTDLAARLEGGQFSLKDKHRLPRATAAFFETVRLTCSPVVPHIATRDTSVEGYRVRAGTMILINNHHTHFSPKLWDAPSSYQPDRFLKAGTGAFTKPAHFQPFSMGRRSCMGSRLVESITVSLLAALVARFEFSCAPAHRDHQAGMLALPNAPFLFTVRPPAERCAPTG